MATPFVRFPGLAGNNISTQEENLTVNADTAHLQQSIGTWVNGSNAVGIQQSTALTPVFGSFHGEWTVNTSATSFINSGSGTANFTDVVGNTLYTVALSFAGVVAVPGIPTIEIRFNWYDAAGGLVGQSPVTPTAITPGFTQIVQADTSPATAVRAFVQLIARNPTAGDVMYWDAVMFAAGSSTVFIPSVDIVGTVFVDEVSDPSPASVSYPPPGDLVVGDAWSGDLSRWTLHDGADASAPVVAQILATDAIRALSL